MSYKIQYGLAIGLAIFAAMVAAIHAMGAEALGLSSIAVNWLDIAVAGAVIAEAVLPNIRRPPEPDVNFRD